jgi:uncharacterized protein YciI
MKYVVTYEAAEDVASKAPAHYPAHAARARDFHSRGDLLMIGVFEDAQADGALGIFPTRRAAEAFIRDDPFVLHGVVRAWHIRGWNEVLEPDPVQATEADA